MADSGHIHNGFSPICAPQNVDGEAVTQPNTHPYLIEMSHFSHEQYRNILTRAGNFHQNAQLPYCQSVTNESTTSDYNEWNQTVSNQCTTPNHDFYQSARNPESIILGYNAYKSIRNKNQSQSISNDNRCRSIQNFNPHQTVPNESPTLNYNGHQHVKPHEVINISETQNDCNKSEQMVHSTTLSSMEASTSSLPHGLRRRIKYTPGQTAILKSVFASEKKPNSYRRRQLATVFQIDEEKIATWFRRRRYWFRRRKDEERNKLSLPLHSSHTITNLKECNEERNNTAF